MRLLLASVLYVAVLLTAIGAPSAHAQEPAGPAPAIRPGAPVRLLLVEGDTLAGAFVSRDAHVFRLRTPEAEQDVPVESVAALWERVPAPGRGAWRGALLGGAVVGGGGLALNYAMCDYDCDRALGFVVGTAGGAAVGALLGTVWGALQGRWVAR